MEEPQVNSDEPDGNQLQVIVQEASLPESKAKYILSRFQDYFNMSDEWAKQTRNIVVTDASQTTIMDMARVCRLAIREKRLAIEKSRKELKADILREGKAIDGIANVLFALLEPLEVYYDKQEHFVKYQEEEKAELIRLEVQKRVDEEIAAAAREKEQEDRRIREENESLRQQALEQEEERRKERAEAERKRLEAEKKAKDEQEKIKKENEPKIAEENRKRQAELDLVRKQEAEKLAKERAEREKVESELRTKKEAEAKAERERIAKEEALKKAGDSEKMANLIKDIQALKYPVELKSDDAKLALRKVNQLMLTAIGVLEPLIMEEVDF